MPNAKAFTKYKLASKGAMIINMVPLNARCAATGQRIRLPTLENLGDTFREAARNSRTMWFCKLEVANMFWSCWVPEEEKNTIRIGVMDEVWGFHGLPFGWTHSLVIATKLLAKTLKNSTCWIYRPCSMWMTFWCTDSTETGSKKQDGGYGDCWNRMAGSAVRNHSWSRPPSLIGWARHWTDRPRVCSPRRGMWQAW